LVFHRLKTIKERKGYQMKKMIVIILAVLLLLSLPACSASDGKYMSASVGIEEPELYEYHAAADEAFYGSDYKSYGASGENLNYDYEESYEYAPQSAEESTAPKADVGQKLIRRISLSVETEDYQAFIDAITKKINALGGYIEDMDARTSGGSPRATILVRVPADQLSALTESVSGIGNITYKHESQQDVTLQYVDTESHITALRTEQERLLELLSKAENLSEVLEIEDRMSYVRYELESYEQSLRALSNQISYATATIDVQQVKVYTPVEEEEVGYWEGIRRGLSSSVKRLWEGAKELFSNFVISLPILILCLLIPALILFLLIKHWVRKSKARRANAPAKVKESAASAENSEYNDAP